MKTLLSAWMTLALSASVFAADPTCSTLEKYGEEDQGLFETYFKELRYKTTHSRRLEDRQKRLAFADFYGTCPEGIDPLQEGCYAESLTAGELDNLGEGIYADTFAGKDGTLYTVVSLGFGGGNGIQYFFRFGTLKLLDLTVVDGTDCGKLQRPAPLK